MVASDRGGCFSDQMMCGVCRGVGIGEVLPVEEVGEEDEVLDAEDAEPMRVLHTLVLPSYATC